MSSCLFVSVDVLNCMHLSTLEPGSTCSKLDIVDVDDDDTRL